MARIEMVMGDRGVSGRAAAARLDRDIVVARIDPRVRDRHVRRIRRIDAIRIARAFWRADLYSPRGETVGVAKADMEIRRVTQRNAVQRKVVARLQFDK